ncbi:MAG: Ppx/GppA family phosphatase [Deltaproteobacteria bacterium]|nr:Ppx/GppA family phosphatase [Deltaproteobacteria bacterium]
MKNLAAIDVGTNSIRLLIAPEGQAHNPLMVGREIVRLGASLDGKGLIGPDEWHRGLNTLERFKGELKRFDVRQVRIGGTAVLRRAGNADLFVREVSERLGLKVEVLTEEAEARLSVRGVLSAVKVRSEFALVFDVGGGSTEFVLCRGSEILSIISAPLGAVVLTDRFLKYGDPPGQDSLRELHRYLAGRIGEVAASFRSEWPEAFSEDVELVGTAGTVATLAAMLQQLPEYDPHRVNNYRMERDRLARLVRRMISLGLNERSEMPGLEPGRADIIVAGAEIVLSVMEAWKRDVLVAADAGLLEGLLLSIS